MIAASFWSLLSPAIDLSNKLGYIEWIFPALGFITGGLFVLLSDKFLDKVLKNKKSIYNDSSLKRCILLISAITIHNIPEGMAIGVAFGGIASGIPGVNLISAIMLAVGIGIQNLPEGAAVSLPLRREGVSRFKSFMFRAGISNSRTYICCNWSNISIIYQKYTTFFTCICSRCYDYSSS